MLLVWVSVTLTIVVSSGVRVLASGCMSMCGCDFVIVQRLNYIVLIESAAQASTTDGII
jgi:hypothetical protein